MKVGLSSASFYPGLTEDAIKILSDEKIPYIELFLNTFCELKREYIKEIKQKLNRTNVVSVHPFTSELESFFFFSEYKKRFKDGIEFYKRLFEIVNELGAKYLIFHGVHNKCKISDYESFERFEKLSDCAKENGVVLLQENVSRCKSASIDYIKRMKENLKDNVNFVLDVKQAKRSGVSPFEMAKAMGENIKHIHISDQDENSDCLLPLKGNFDFKKLINIMNHFGYIGAYIIEVYNDSYNLTSELINSYKKFNDELNNLNL